MRLFSTVMLALAAHAGVGVGWAAPRLEVVVVGPSADEMTLYGHAAVLVVEGADPVPESRVFNFGITDFERPNYVLDFLTGRVKFWGKEKTWERVSSRWIREDRTVWRYPVHLPPAQVDALIVQMTHDVQPENREYVYDTFRENCATRLRDYLNQATGGAVFAALGSLETGRSYRDDVRHAYSENPLLLLLTEVVPGVDLDAERTVWELSYRPETLGPALTRVTVDGAPLVGPPIVINTRRGPDPRSGDPHIAQYYIGGFAALVAALALLAGWLPGRARGALLALWALLSGGLGLLLWVVWATSDWPDMQRNWLAVGCVPLDFSLGWTALRLLSGKTSVSPWVGRYLRLRLVTTVAVLGFGPAFYALRGPLPPRLVALVGVLLALRCVAPIGRDSPR